MIEDNFPSAKVICHSEAPNGEQLITLELEFHRFILSELNTHRSFSRNAQSSRAVPIEKMIEQVRNNPAIPVHWGKNQKGMVAEQEHFEFIDMDWALPEFEKLGINLGKSPEQAWRIAATYAADVAESFNEAGYHKQIVNRILEPFMRTKGVVTATKDAYDSFFKLRCHKDAQPEIKLLAERMHKVIAESKPNKLQHGEYHLPYVNLDLRNKPTAKNGDQLLAGGFHLGISDAVRVSCSCTAQVSYRRLDDSLDKALKVYDMLNLPVDGVYPEDPPHYSPTEHIARVMSDETYCGDDALHQLHRSGNFHSKTFWQYRKALEMGLEKYFLGDRDE